MSSIASAQPMSVPAAAQSRRRIDVGRLAAHAALLFFVVLWTFPTVGLLISSVRDKDQLAVSGWWTALTAATTQNAARVGAATDQVQEGNAFVIRGNILGGDTGGREILSFGATNADLAAHPAGTSLQMRDGGDITVAANGDYVWSSATEFTHTARPRIYYVLGSQPRFTLDNYIAVLSAEGIAQSFVNSITVAIPSTVIPILISAFAAYALAWMRFPGRGLVVALVVGVLVVPLQMSLIPLLRIYIGVSSGLADTNYWIQQFALWLAGGPLPWLGQAIGTIQFPSEPKSYPSVWLAHTAFGLPLAIYLLRNYMAGLPREIMESARIDGASHFKIFTTMVLPLSFPALASFAIFQFLWVWNDLLVALVFLGAQNDKVVLTGKLVSLLGTQGDNWELLTSGAFVSIVVPLIVFFSLQRYFVRGLLAGSVK